MPKCNFCPTQVGIDDERYWGGRRIPVCRPCQHLAEAGGHPAQPENKLKAHIAKLNLPGYVYIARQDAFVWARGTETVNRTEMLACNRPSGTCLENPEDAQPVTRALLAQLETDLFKRLRKIDEIRRFHRGLPEG